MYIEISQLKEFDLKEYEEVSTRWNTIEGIDALKHIEKKIRQGAGEDFLQGDVQYGVLKNFLKDEFDLRGISLNRIDLKCPYSDNFQNLDFSYGKLHICTFEDCLFDSTFYFVKFKNCTFKKCTLASSYFKGCYFVDCIFDEVDFFIERRFENCVIENTTFEKFYCPGNILSDCKISNSSEFSEPLTKSNYPNWDHGFNKKTFSDFFNELNLGYKRSGAFKKASDNRFKAEKCHTRYNSKNHLEKWFRILILELMIGYGERPIRTLLASLFVIVAFSFLYLLLGFAVLKQPGSSEEFINYTLNFTAFSEYLFDYSYYKKLASDFMKAFQLSSSAFIVVGPAELNTTNSSVKFLLIIEGFLGATLIGAWTALLLKKFINR